MRIFESKRFARFARKEPIIDAALCQAITDAQNNRIDADYGGGVIKQRIARPNQGKSGGYWSIILFRRGERAFFVYGFAKNQQSNIDESDERDFKELARVLLSASDAELKTPIERNEILEVPHHDQT